MAPRERIAMWRLGFLLAALAVYAVFTLAARDGQLHGHEWLITAGFLLVGISMRAVLKKPAPEDEREILIGLLANRLVLAVALSGVFALCAVFSFGRGMWAPVPSGALVCVILAALAAGDGARLYYYRRGV